MTTTQERTSPAESVYEAAPSELKELLERAPDQVFVVDIQDPETFDTGHIPGARNIPLEDVVASCSALSKELTVVIYCGSVTCGLPLGAALELARLGFRAKYLRGGLEEWARGKLPIEISPPPPDPEY